MIRPLILAGLGITAMLALASPAEARSRDQAQAQSRQAAPQANRAATTRAAAAPQRQAARQAPAATRQAATSRDARGARQAAARSGGRQQVASSTCRGRNCAPRTRTVSWQGGLEPATNAQAHACPSGTLATLAHGHSDIVRCMPL